jgi:hypothetical protein
VKRSQAADPQLQQLAKRLLRTNTSSRHTPVIISGVCGGESFISAGRLLEQNGGSIKVRTDMRVELQCALNVFMPDRAYVAEAMSCTPQRAQYLVELTLIQQRG